MKYFGMIVFGLMFAGVFLCMVPRKWLDKGTELE